MTIIAGNKVNSLQALRFAVVGSLTAAIYFGMYNLLRIAEVASPIMASAMTYCAAVSFQYVGHSWFTFGKPVFDIVQFMRFLATNACGFAFSISSTYLMVSVCLMPDWVASGLIVITLPIINWFVMRRWVFN
ncbi:GtrA family protein [Yoonia maritima]|uniref:GtrA family protein n=1 Tax=Yoonia maritima TaxID=1435347 RepID=UPI000D0EC957